MLTLLALSACIKGYRLDLFSPQNLKSILHSKRANLYYLEKYRVIQKEKELDEQIKTQLACLCVARRQAKIGFES